jgi:hypothetical protein
VLTLATSLALNAIARPAGGGGPAALSVSGTMPFGVETGEAWAGATVTAAGGTLPYTYSVVGTAPTGLTINSSTGLFSGTHSGTPGTLYTFTIRVTDGASATADLAVAMVGRLLRDTSRPSPYADDTGTNGHLGYQHVDTPQYYTVGGVQIVGLGYSKHDANANPLAGAMCYMERCALSGEVIDARIMRQGEFNSNDHLNGAGYLVQSGPHAGKLWAHTNSHVGADNAGVYYFFCSRSGRAADLFLVGAVDYGEQHNLGHFREVTTGAKAGRLTLLIGQDVPTPQQWKMTWTDSPEVVPNATPRDIYGQTGVTDQIYVHAAPGELENEETDFVFVHPNAVTAPDVPLRIASRRLGTGELFVNGVRVGAAEDIYASSGATMANVTTLPAIVTPPAGQTHRFYSACHSGRYAGARAVLLGRQTQATPTDVTHWLYTCEPGLDKNDPLNWVGTQIGGTGEAAPLFWSSGLYSADCWFIATATGIRIGRWANKGTFGAPRWRVEEWAGADAASIALDVSGPPQISVRPFGTRGHPIRGAGAESLAIKYYGGRHDDYPTYQAAIPASMVVVPVTGSGKASPLWTERPIVTGGTAVGDLQTCTPGVWAGTPTPSIARQWFRVASEVAASEHWERIAGATGTTYTRTAADAGFCLICRETGTNTHGAMAADSLRTAVGGGAALWSPSDISGLVWAAWDGQKLTALGGAASQWDSFAGSLSASWSQSTPADQGFASFYDGGRHVRLEPTNATTGPDWLDSDAAIRDVFRAKSAVGAIIIAQSRSGASQRHLLHMSVNGPTANPRFLMRQTSGGLWELRVRCLDGDSSSIVTGPSVGSSNADVILCGLANYAVGGSTAQLFLNSANVGGAPSPAPNAQAATSNTASSLCRLGTSDTGGSNFQGRLYGQILFAKASGAITTGERENLEGWLAHRLGKQVLLPAGSRRTTRPTI